jgi:hypothetical protein
MDFVVEEAGRERVVQLRGRAALVPQGLWHTARVFEPSEAMFVTRGTAPKIALVMRPT